MAQEKTKAMQELVTRLYQENKSVIPSEIVKKSKPKTSPTHGCFEWDDKKAGSEYRLEQARRWIRKIKIEIPDTGETKVTKFRLHHVPSVGGRGAGEYKAPPVIVENPSEFERAMKAALADLDSAQARVDELKTAAQDMGEEDKASILAGLMYTLQSAGDILRKLQ